jgi:antitoxin (DNA-binding transcriptional repressor) of toxin-antitoxin stability system
MRSVGIKILKNKLSEYVRLAGQGETVLVTERDRVVAELTPPAAGRTLAVRDSLLADAVRNGLVTAPLGAGIPLPAPQPVASLARVLADLDRDRGDR